MSHPKADSASLLQQLVDANLAAEECQTGFDRESLKPVHALVRKRLDERGRQRLAAPLPSRTDFDAAFVDGQGFLDDDDGRTITTTVREVGKLRLTSGRVVTCDPLLGSSGLTPLARTVPPGQYPVVLSVVRGRVACAMLRFRKSRPVRWELATRPGQDLAKLGPGRIFTYSVDSGIGSFLDADQIPHLGKLLDGVLIDSRAESATDSLAGEWGERVLNDATGGNLIAFHSGWGDGGYGSYWGLNSAGDPVSLVTDFRLLISPQRISFVVPGAFLRPPGEVRHRALDLGDLVMELAPGTRPGRSLIVGFLGSGAHSTSARLNTSDGTAVPLASSGINMSWEGDVEYYYDEKVLTRVRSAKYLADLQLRVTLGLNSCPMQAIGPQPPSG